MSQLKFVRILFLLALFALPGCKPKDVEPDPSTIPKIPPSTRGGGGEEGGPGGGKTGKLEPPKK